jgi:dUTP pyrophosphatase
MNTNPNIKYYTEVSPIGRPILDLLDVNYGGKSCIETLQYLSYEEGVPFMVLTGIKYIWRLGQKTQDLRSDLLKAIDYFQWALEDLFHPLPSKLASRVYLAIHECERLLAVQPGDDLRVKIFKLHELAQVPEYAHVGDSGADLKAIEFTEVPAGGWRKISTGLAIELPHGMEAQIRSRSGLAARYGICVLNSPGTIDASYTGEICVLLINHSLTDFRISIGDKIAQLVVCPVANNVRFDSAEMIAKSTSRGSDGFGSTGIFASDV